MKCERVTILPPAINLIYHNYCHYFIFCLLTKKGANSEQLKVIQIKRISMATKLLPLNLYTILTIWKWSWNFRYPFLVLPNELLIEKSTLLVSSLSWIILFSIKSLLILFYIVLFNVLRSNSMCVIQ